MAMPAWMPEAWAQLNEEDQKSVSDFMSFLLNRKKPAQEEATLLKPVNYGVFKGRIKVPENFDDPLPEFEEYM